MASTSIRWSHWTWEECRVYWEAKGYKLDSIAAEFEKKFGENSGFSRTTLAERSKSTEGAPPEVIELVWSLSLMPGASKRRFEIVKRGLEEGAPLADLEALLADTGGKLDAFGAKLDSVLSAVGGKVDAILSAVGKLNAALSAVGKLASVLSAVGANMDGILLAVRGKVDGTLSAVGKLGAALSALGGKLDAAFSALDGKVDAILSALGKLAAAVSALGGKLDGLEGALSALRTIEATVNHTDAKQDVEHATLERATRKILRAVYGSAGLLGLGIFVIAFVQCQHVLPSPPSPSSPSVTVNLGTGVAEQGARGGQWDPYGTLVRAISGEMGEHKGGRLMPHHPLPHQAVAPCQGSAKTLYGSCWFEGKDSAPCPPDQYQEGQSCYIPLSADPNVPVQPSSEQARPGQGEPTGEQPRPMQAMPGRDEH